MSDSVINRIVATAPEPGHQICLARLDGVSTLSLSHLHERAERLARGLRRLGIGHRTRIGICASNGLDWVLLDLAALRLGAVTAGFEPGKFDPDARLLAKYDLAVLFTDRPFTGAGIRAMSELADIAGHADPAAELPPVQYAPHDVTSIKFTSGSTGEPKGLAATAGSIDSSVNAVQEMFEHGSDDNLFVFLPLSLLQQRYWVYSALCFGHDITISTYEAAFAALRQVRPTVIMGVPAFFETAKKHIESRARVARARTQGGRPPDPGTSSPAGQHDRAPTPWPGSPARKETEGESLRSAAMTMFGDRIRYLWTGSAPARPSMLRFFTGLGMPIYEGYGLNETCIVSKNYPGAHREGSVGRVLPGKKVLFDSDGVISIASDYPVNWRYEYAAPGESERVFQPDGTVRTGDLGYIDDDGFLFIRGRADDVIVLDNGKKVIVRPIEEFMKASQAIEECVVLCPTQTHLVAVVSPASQPADADAITARVTEANATFSRDEQISNVVIADEPFSIGNGLLTSQFKPRRERIMQAYQDQVLGQASQRLTGGAPGDGA